ncbi:SDR family NAD(P)-dependent oxidoreductase [Actibacterium sp. 188UL27-1]|uniref:SDR family NAD(P)-dependent oxidoreductase n=1 Tax=Actibacterium sp. 188UL27-1 TaxID=2786961 RepID=UPI0019589640|nr:SDR family oxidoreductase [Actibacterium sp. 188UL27-1]MBM7069688.1 SDR family oxidoreductase [Actibacterium sp. 188UL27-1]
MAEFAIYPSLKGKTVFVTGGASGIGADILRGFADQGARLGFVDLDATGSASRVAELEEAGSEVAFAQADLRDIAALKAAFASLIKTLGAPYALVNNAARDDRHGWEDVTEEYYDERIATNLRHMFFATQAVAPAMIEAGQGGAIVNMGSNSWWEASGGMPIYTTSKAAVHGMTRSFARDLGPHRIRVNTVVPGWIMTERQKELWVTKEALDRHLARQCLKNPIAPEYVARTVIWLCSKDAAMCTASNFFVDGGSV